MTDCARVEPGSDFAAVDACKHTAAVAMSSAKTFPGAEAYMEIAANVAVVVAQTDTDDDSDGEDACTGGVGGVNALTCDDEAFNKNLAREDSRTGDKGVSRTSEAAVEEPAEASANRQLADCVEVCTGFKSAMEGTFEVQRCGGRYATDTDPG